MRQPGRCTFINSRPCLSSSTAAISFSLAVKNQLCHKHPPERKTSLMSVQCISFLKTPQDVQIVSRLQDDTLNATDQKGLVKEAERGFYSEYVQKARKIVSLCKSVLHSHEKSKICFVFLNKQNNLWSLIMQNLVFMVFFSMKTCPYMRNPSSPVVFSFCQKMCAKLI